MRPVEAFTIPEAGLLRLVTAGSVDDGKSTLIGRLLYDSKGIFEDQLAALENVSRRRGKGELDLSLLTDGLQAEREQGITIDVAYRYFATPRRRFIIADSPGHEQYTRNMVTAASTASAAVVLVDARRGILTQTRRHSFIASLLGIRHVVFAVNKMDLVEFSEARFAELRQQLEELASSLGLPHARCVPLSALLGDNVVERSESMPWYEGPALLELLETVDDSLDLEALPLRFPVQTVVRPRAGLASEDRWHDFRGYGGRLDSGIVRVGDPVAVLPSGLTARVSGIHTHEGPVALARARQSVMLLLDEALDVSRGDLLSHVGAQPRVATEFSANLCWLASSPLDRRRRLLLKHTTKTVRVSVASLDYRVDVNNLERHAAPETLAMNDVGAVQLRVTQPLALDAYGQNRFTGSFILIDEATNATVAAGMVLDA